MKIALYRNGKYVKAEIINGKIVEEELSNELKEVRNRFLFVMFGIILTEEMIKEFNIPNLGYTKTEEGFVIFDKKVLEYDEETLPAFVDISGRIIDTKKYVTVKTPTDDTCTASYKISNELEDKVRDYSKEMKFKKICEDIEKNGGIAYFEVTDLVSRDLSHELYRRGIKMLLSYKYSQCIVGTVASKPILDLYVPKEMMAVVIGKGGQKIKELAEKVKAKRINVKPLEV